MYGKRGFLKIVFVSASSKISPPYIIAILSATSATTPRLCVISIIDSLRDFLSCRSRSRICASITTSRAVVGSSAISSFGSSARPKPIIIRCFIPPLSW